MASWAGNDPAIACLRGRALGHSCFTTKTNGAADGTRTRMNSVDSGVPYLSASTAQMGVSESTRLLLDHSVFRLGAPTKLRTRQSVVCPAIRRRIPQRLPCPTWSGRRDSNPDRILRRDVPCPVERQAENGTGGRIRTFTSLCS